VDDYWTTRSPSGEMFAVVGLALDIIGALALTFVLFH
jgi:hypothetical protein